MQKLWLHFPEKRYTRGKAYNWRADLVSTDWESLIPKPKSRFLRVRCPECENEQIVYSSPSNIVKCNICKAILATPTGGKARIEGEITAVMG
jgi:small subunit ribosomal protein S27e